MYEKDIFARLYFLSNMVNLATKTDVLFYRDNKLNPQSFTMENEFHYLGNNVLLEGADRSSYSSIGDDLLLVTPIKEGFFDGFLDGLGKFALGVAAGLAGVACVAAIVCTGGLALAAAGVVAMSTVGSAVIGESATQIMDREFRPMDFDLTIDFMV